MRGEIKTNSYKNLVTIVGSLASWKFIWEALNAVLSSRRRQVGALAKDFHRENKQLALICLALGRITLGNLRRTC